MKASEILLAIFICLFILYFYNYYKYSAHNTRVEQQCKKDVCTNFRVHREHADYEKAAELMEEINSRNLRLLEHLRGTWLQELKTPEPEKQGRIDVIPSSKFLTHSTTENLATREYIQQRVQQLVDNYDQDNISEISPLNAAGNTSYAENKQRLVLCLREKETGLDAHHDLHDINTVMFVVLHELAHIANDKWGHSYESGFWQLFKFLLIEAEKINIYTPVNYAQSPITYCGLDITYSPLFDVNLKI